MNFQTSPGHQSFGQENICLDETRKGIVHCSIILISVFGQYQDNLTEIFQGHYPVTSFEIFSYKKIIVKTQNFNPVLKTNLNKISKIVKLWKILRVQNWVQN